MNDPHQELSTHISKAIVAIQNILNDSRTPVTEAIKLVRPLRRLTLCRQELDLPAIRLEPDIEYADAIAKLEKVGRTGKSDLLVRQEHIAFVALSADAAATALRLTVRAVT